MKKSPVKIIFLDVLKPHEPNILDLGKAICQDESVLDVNVTVYAVDENTESTKVTLSGKDINYST